MHVGEKPYVVTTSASMYAYRGPLAWGHVELSSRVLTTDAVAGMLEQLLPSDQLKALVEYGAIEYDLPHEAASDLFTVVAARGGDDVWLELRRKPASLGTMGEPEPVHAPAASESPSVGSTEPESAISEPVGTSFSEELPGSVAPQTEPTLLESAAPHTETISETAAAEEQESIATAPEVPAQASAVTEPTLEPKVDVRAAAE